MDKISVILPIYNVASNLEQCFNSISNQTYQNLEIILVNDGSTDNSFAMCLEYLKQEPRAKLINQTNQGRGVARNRGTAEATGDFITFIDPDDYVEFTYLEHLHNQIIKYNSDIAICCMRIRKNNKEFIPTHPMLEKIVGVYSNQQFLAQYGNFFDPLYLSLTGPYCKIIRHTPGQEHFFPTDRRYAEDTKAMWRFYLNANRISIEKDYDYIYNQPTNSNQKTALQQFELIRALEEQMTFLQGLGIDITSYYHLYQSTLKTAQQFARVIGNAGKYQELCFKLEHLYQKGK